MEEVFKNPVQLSEGVKLRDLLSSGTDFHIDADFNKKNRGLLDKNGQLLESDDDEDEKSDSEDIMTGIEESVKKLMLSSPEYKTFSELSEMMIDCLPNGDVKLLIVEEGDGSLVPTDAEVTIHYTAYWEGETIPFDSTLTMNFGAPQRLKLGTNSVLPGLEIGLNYVHGPSARFHLLLHPRVTWGEMGALPRIRPHPALFVIALYDVKDGSAGKRFNDLPLAEQTKFEVTMKTVKSIHVQAKSFFAKKKYVKAIRDYQQAIHVMRLSRHENEMQETEINKLKIKNYINLAVCYYKLDKPKYVLNMCECLDQLIDTEKHCKILFYYARAYEMLTKFDEAIKYYKKALKLEPRNKDIGAALAALEDKIKEAAVNEKSFWQNAFNVAEEKKDTAYEVDEEFRDSVNEMCESLAGSKEYTKFDLDSNLTSNEVDFVKDVTRRFDKLIVLEEEKGSKKKISIVKVI